MSGEWEKLMDEHPWIGDLPRVEPESDKTEIIDAGVDLVRTGMYSDIGRRSSQQDAAMVSESYEYIENQRILAVMCDGMGGLSGGDVASGYCVKKMFEAFGGISEEVETPVFYTTMVRALDRNVKQMKKADGSALGAGTTLVSIVIENGDLYWASVGDSRIYIISDAGIMCLTKDHNYKMLLDQQVAQGEITQREADKHPKREALLSYIGQGGVKYVDIPPRPFQLKGGDRLLLCSDGLYRTLPETEMAEIIRAAGDDMEAAARELVCSAIRKGKKNQDNTTAVLVKYLDPQ